MHPNSNRSWTSLGKCHSFFIWIEISLISSGEFISKNYDFTNCFFFSSINDSGEFGKFGKVYIQQSLKLRLNIRTNMLVVWMPRIDNNIPHNSCYSVIKQEFLWSARSRLRLNDFIPKTKESRRCMQMQDSKGDKTLEKNFWQKISF